MQSPTRAALLAAAAVLLAPALAGCLDETVDEAVPDAQLACVAGTCNFLATVAPAERQANELSIAVNPLDPQNIIATGKDYTPSEAGDCVWDGVYTTHDGGRTWRNGNVPGSPWRAFSSDPTRFEPHPQLSKFWCATDPVVAFGPDGTAYWTVMPYQCDRLSGSETGRGLLPDGGFNDWLWTCSSMYVLVSEDGGDTWPIVREVDFGPRLEHDKQWIATAPNGNVLLCWDRDPMYQITSLLENPTGENPTAQLTPNGFITCSVSTDKGRTWADPVDANRDFSDPTGRKTTWMGFLPWVDYASDNTAWMAAINLQNVIVTRSDDGLAWDAPMTVGHYEDPPRGGEYGWPVLYGSDFRMFAVPSLAVDRSGGPYDGSVYVAWFDHSAGHGRILFTYSRDGEEWAAPRPIRDASPNAEHDQFMPAVSVGPDGTVDLTWYDRRDDPANHRFRLYYSYSLDGGATFAADLPVADQLSDEQFSHHQNGMVFLGDYIDLASSDGMAHAVWVDTRNEKADVFVANIARPGANG